MKKLVVILFLVTGNVFSIHGQDMDSSITQNEDKAMIMIDGQNSVPLTHENQPLIIIKFDSKEFQIEPEDTIKMSQIKPDWIESIHVLKGPNAVDEYDNKGKNGVVIIEIKTDSIDRLPPEILGNFR